MLNPRSEKSLIYLLRSLLELHTDEVIVASDVDTLDRRVNEQDAVPSLACGNAKWYMEEEGNGAVQIGGNRTLRRCAACTKISVITESEMLSKAVLSCRQVPSASIACDHRATEWSIRGK